MWANNGGSHTTDAKDRRFGHFAVLFYIFFILNELKMFTYRNNEVSYVFDSMKRHIGIKGRVFRRFIFMFHNLADLIHMFTETHFHKSFNLNVFQSIRCGPITAVLAPLTPRTGFWMFQLSRNSK